MSKVEIDVTANTSQAERAMVALTGDVDKLLSRARKLQNRRERDRKENRIELREQSRYQRKPSVDVKVINNNTTELGNSLENLTNLFESFADKIGGSGGAINNKLFVRMNQSKDGISLGMIEALKQDYTIANISNFNTLPVLIAMFINREQLRNEIYEQHKSVMITRGDKLVMFGKDASDSLKRKALKFINE